MHTLIGGVTGIFMLGIVISNVGAQSHKEQSTENQEKYISPSKHIFECLKNFPGGTQASIALIENGEVSFIGAIKKNDSTFHTDNHNQLFEIGSITKVFNAILLANTTFDKEIALDETISSYIGLNDSVKIRFKQLANHTSGLPRLPSNFNQSAFLNPGNPYKNYNEKMLTDYLDNDFTLLFEPGTKMVYSNLGAGILGYILTKITNTSYEKLLDSCIFSKYNMTSSTTQTIHDSSRLVAGLNANGEKTSNWNFSCLVGAGGILSTSNDLAKFVLAQFNDLNKELKLARKKTFKVNENLHIGLGWHILIKPDSEWFWHNGGTGGYTSSLAFNTETKNGVVILTNVSTFHTNSGKIDQLCFSLLSSIEQQGPSQND